jgi:hypothetical protein
MGVCGVFQKVALHKLSSKYRKLRLNLLAAQITINVQALLLKASGEYRRTGHNACPTALRSRKVFMDVQDIITFVCIVDGSCAQRRRHLFFTSH